MALLYLGLRNGFLMMALFTVSAHVVAQKANPERSKSLKEVPANKKARVVAYNYQSTYTYEPASDKMTVVNNDVIDLVSLEGNVNYVRAVFYNENLALSNTEIKYANGKSVKHENVCGNYEVDHIFYSDAKVVKHKKVN